MAATTVTALFDQFRQEIDDYNDTRERLIKVLSCIRCTFTQNFDLMFFHNSRKASRDVTNLSKKTIFLIHRMALEDSTDDDTAKRAAKHGYESLRKVQAIFATLSIELQGDKFWRYQRQVSPGLQEYIEALSFAYFLDHGSLITFDQVQATLSDPDGIPVRLKALLMNLTYMYTLIFFGTHNSTSHCRFLIIFSAYRISLGSSCVLLYLAFHTEVAGKKPAMFVPSFGIVKQVSSCHNNFL